MIVLTLHTDVQPIRNYKTVREQKLPNVLWLEKESKCSILAP